MALAANGATQTIYIKQESGTLYWQINTAGWNTISNFPITIQNTNPTPSTNILKVIFTSDITITDDITYFVCGSDGIQFGSESLKSGGSMTNIYVDVSSFNGLIQNGTFNNARSYIFVYNISVSASGTTILTGGWIGQHFYGSGGNNNYIINCSSSGDISNDCGGICGVYSGYGSVQTYLYIYGCRSYGAIGDDAGGIIGNSSGQNGGHVYCEQCFSKGNINGTRGGGIFGSQSGTFGGYISALRCYSTGDIIGEASGGILGSAAGDIGGTAIVENSYSTGAISGINAGGIVGGLGGFYTGNILIKGCYSVGNISADSGGIFGIFYYAPGSSLNNYVAGSTATTKGYIFAGNINIPPNNYSEAFNNSSGWNSVHANSVLLGIPSFEPGAGSIWASTSLNTPYELTNFGYTPYSLQVVNGNSLVQSYSQTVQAGDSTIIAINADASGNSFTILQINNAPYNPSGPIKISQQTGAISTTSSTEPMTYTIIVRSIGSYNITTFTLTVTAVVTATGEIIQIPCCAVQSNLTGLNYDIQADALAGNTLIANFPQRRGPISYTALLKMKIASASKRR